MYVANVSLHQVSFPMKIRQLKPKLLADASKGEPPVNPEDSSFSSGVIFYLVEYV